MTTDAGVERPSPTSVWAEMKEGNARYEARFGRVFLIRAKGRGGDEILAALSRRLQNSERAEVEDALAQLREITLLRLEGAIGE